MTNEAVQKWIEALRSGEYRQGRLQLGDHMTGYCCLGVACQLAINEGILDKDDYLPGDTDLARYPEVQKWLGLESPSGRYGSWETVSSLAHDNDGSGIEDAKIPPKIPPKPFDEIADIIESRPEGLFTDAD